MSRQVDHDDFAVPAIPDAALVVAGAEVATMRILKSEAEAEVAQIRGAIRARSGTLAASVGSSVRRIPAGGVSVKFGAIKQVAFQTRKGDRILREMYGGEGGKVKRQDAFYADFVDRGTGARGPLGQLIRRRGLVPVAGGFREPSGVGQAPQHMFRDARERWTARQAQIDEQIEADLTRRIEARR